MNKNRLIRNDREVKPFIASDGATVFELFNPGNSNIENISLASGFLDHDQSARLHCHKISEEIYYVLSGIGRVRLGGFDFDIKSGDAIYVPIGLTHGLVNTQPDQNLKVLVIESPPYSNDDIYFID